MNQVLHNVHQRKRIHLKKEPYPHPDKFKRLMDKLAYAGGGLGLVFTLPQLTKIWIDKTASGVSAISWMAYAVGAIFWVIYGIAHKEKPIILTYSIWIILDILIVIGTLMYG